MTETPKWADLFGVAPDLPVDEEPTYTESEVKELTTKATAVALALGRKGAAEDLRFLSAARKDYCARCPEHQGDLHDMGPMAQAVHDDHDAAARLADILDGQNDARGWLPSWRWDEWVARGPQAASEPRTVPTGHSDLPPTPEAARSEGEPWV